MRLYYSNNVLLIMALTVPDRCYNILRGYVLARDYDPIELIRSDDVRVVNSDTLCKKVLYIADAPNIIRAVCNTSACITELESILYTSIEYRRINTALLCIRSGYIELIDSHIEDESNIVICLHYTDIIRQIVKRYYDMPQLLHECIRLDTTSIVNKLGMTQLRACIIYYALYYDYLDILIYLKHDVQKIINVKFNITTNVGLSKIEKTTLYHEAKSRTKEWLLQLGANVEAEKQVIENDVLAEIYMMCSHLLLEQFNQ